MTASLFPWAGPLRDLRAASSYAAQRAVVAVMFDVIARLLEAASHADPVLARELAGFPEGHVIGFAVLGDSLAMRVRVREGRFVRAGAQTRPDFEVVFKHVSHAFLVVTFQEGTAVAFAHERAISHGDTALGMRFVRCLNRMQALALPEAVVKRALKAPLPTLSKRTRLTLTSALYAQLAEGLFTRRNA